MEKVTIEIYTEGNSGPLVNILSSTLDALEQNAPELGISSDPGTSIQAGPYNP